MNKRPGYHSVPLRTKRPPILPNTQAPQSHISRTQLPALPDDSRVTTIPRSAIRYTTPQGQTVIQQGNRRVVIHPVTEETPIVTKRKRRRGHPWLYAGLGMLVAVGLLIAGSAGASAWNEHNLDSQYGYPRTFQIDAVVGHHDSREQPTHFIFQNLRGVILITEYPGGLEKNAHIYNAGPLLGEDADKIPVTGTFTDVNHDGRVDMVIQIEGQMLVYLNDGSQFKAPGKE